MSRGRLVGFLACGILVLALVQVIPRLAELADSTESASEADSAGSGTGGGQSGGEADPAQSDAFKQALAFARCMRKQGVDYPDPDPSGRFSFDGEAVDTAAFERAGEACRELRGTAPPIPEDERDQLTAALLEFAECMREHGLAVPDPDVSGEGGGTAVALPDGLSRDDPDFVAARKACQHILADTAPSATGRAGE